MKRLGGKCVGIMLIIFGAAVLMACVLPPKILVFIMTFVIIAMGISLLKTC